MKRSDIRETMVLLGCSRISLALNAGYKLNIASPSTAGARLSC
jgi:hypothetical protein